MYNKNKIMLKKWVKANKKIEKPKINGRKKCKNLWKNKNQKLN